MARLLEHKAKEVLAGFGIRVPDGYTASTPEEAAAAAERIGGDVVIKAQAFVTGRAGKGLIKFAASPAEARQHAQELLGQNADGFPIELVLVERKLQIERELFAACLVSDEIAAPVAMLGSRGGSGVEAMASRGEAVLAKRPFDPEDGLDVRTAAAMAEECGLPTRMHSAIAEVLQGLAQVFLEKEARSLEVNPLAVLRDGSLVAADCHFSVDDYAVSRHPELEIEIAREIGHPATPLEKIAAAYEETDHRGTFYFLELSATGKKLVGFHGAGGGGSMMSMDALVRHGFTAKNFCDTSGNPSAAKVYRACKHILAQDGIIGYFASGSGVASQEQFHSARGMVKAFREWPLCVPAVIRLGGNKEEVAIDILTRFLGDLPVPVEAYGKDDSAAFCAERLDVLVKAHPPVVPYECVPTARTEPAEQEYRFDIRTGSISFDHAICASCEGQPCIASCHAEILELVEGKPRLKEPAEESAHRCTECLACELACYNVGKRSIRIDLPIPGFEEYLAKRGAK
jgi:succinyl-CoA synthetase beta subunit